MLEYCPNCDWRPSRKQLIVVFCIVPTLALGSIFAGGAVLVYFEGGTIVVTNTATGVSETVTPLDTALPFGVGGLILYALATAIYYEEFIR